MRKEMLPPYHCGSQQCSTHRSRGDEAVNLKEGIVFAEEYVDLVHSGSKDIVQSKQANETESIQKARKNESSIFNIQPTECCSRSNTRLLPLAPKYPLESSANQKTQFSKQQTANHIHPGQSSSRSLPNEILSPRNAKHSSSHCSRDSKLKMGEVATSYTSTQFDERQPSVGLMNKETKQSSRFSRGQQTQTTANVAKRPTQNRIAKKTRKPKNHIGIDETGSDGNDCSGSEEVDTKKEETFACPFYRKDPIRFLECINIRLVTIAIVKQHLRRRHGADSPSPAGRKGSYSSDNDQDHVREEGKIGRLDTIPPHILDDLKIRSDRRISSTAQWHEIWILLFGESNVTPNPLLNGLVKEITGMIRDIWSKEGSQIVSIYLHTRNIPVDSSQLLSLLPELLDKFEGQFGNYPLEDHSEEQYAGIKGPVLETAIGETGVSQKSAAAASRYTDHDLEPSDFLRTTGPSSTACDFPQAISDAQVSHDFASVGGAFESQANSSEFAATDSSTYTEQLPRMDVSSPAVDECDILREGDFPPLAGSNIYTDWLEILDHDYYNFLPE